MIVPPSVRIPVSEGSKLNPPLGSRWPETRHLNLRWSMARLDALRLCLRTSGLPLQRIAELYQSTPPEIERLAREMGEGIRFRRTQP